MEIKFWTSFKNYEHESDRTLTTTLPWTGKNRPPGGMSAQSSKVLGERLLWGMPFPIYYYPKQRQSEEQLHQIWGAALCQATYLCVCKLSVNTESGSHWSSEDRILLQVVDASKDASWFYHSSFENFKEDILISWKAVSIFPFSVSFVVLCGRRLFFHLTFITYASMIINRLVYQHSQ